MAKINVLSQHVADLIAAGEVVERPASVAKELIENAIDAGATFITIELHRGGIEYLRVTDDGCGIAREDVKTALLRHSTSKIHEKEDLEHIATLGFRGEALAAIVAVSKVDLLTKTIHEEIGTSLHQEGGMIHSVDDAGCPNGTTFIVRELFYNTPARMKFLKKDATEGATVENVVVAAALSHPNISFKLIRENKITLHTPGDSKLDSCIYSVLGRDIASAMLVTEGGNHGVSVSGFVSKPIAARGNRAMQHFFVNGRFVKSRMLSAAVEQAYSNLIMRGRFPNCVLKLTLPVELTDVNVHPTKTEIKFASEREVFDAVYYTVKNALIQDTGLVKANIEKSPKAPEIQLSQTSKPSYFTSKPVQEDIHKGKDSIPEVKFSSTVPYSHDVITPIKRGIYVHNEDQSEKSINLLKEPILQMGHSQPGEKPQSQFVDLAEIQSPPTVKSEQKEIHSLFQSERVQAEMQREEKAENTYFRVAGEVLDTYIIVEDEKGIVLIDKHAAHERILFEKLKQKKIIPQTQLLLEPIMIKMVETDILILEDHHDLLKNIGFEIDSIGMGSIAIRQVPEGIAEGDVPAVISEIAGKLQGGRRISAEERIDEILHSIACKAAIKAGMKSSDDERVFLARTVMSRGDIRYCPHGRPVAITMTKNQIEKLFRRA